MIRFIRIGDQITDGQDDFAFWDTVRDVFVTVYEDQVFESISDLREALEISDIEPGYAARLMRFAVAAHPPLKP